MVLSKKEFVARMKKARIKKADFKKRKPNFKRAKPKFKKK